MLDPGFQNFIKNYGKNGAFYRTNDNLSFLRQLQAQLIRMRREASDHGVQYYPDANCFVWSLTTGLMPLASYIKDHDTLEQGSSAKKPFERAEEYPHEVLAKLISENPDVPRFFVFLNVLNRLAPNAPITANDTVIVQRILDIANTNQHRSSTGCMPNVLLFTGTSVSIPPELRPVLSVYHDPGLSQDETRAVIDQFTNGLPTKFGKVDVSPEIEASLFGLPSYIVHNALQVALTATPSGGRMIDPQKINDFKLQVVRKGGHLELIMPSQTGLNALGGLDRFKDWVKVVAPCWTKQGQEAGLVPPKGLILLGIWGCGKSVAAKALASEWGLPMVRIDLGKLRSIWMGSSEANLHEALEIIGGIAPCLVWLDEADKGMAGGGESMTDSGVAARMLGILSTWMQETKKQVCIVCTANSIDKFPSEIVNRADDRFFFDFPNVNERMEIIKLHVAAHKFNADAFDLSGLAAASDCLVGREIEQAVTAAMRAAFFKNGRLTPELLGDALLKELKSRPRLKKTMEDDIKRLMNWVCYDPDADDGIRARLASSRTIAAPAVQIL